MPNSIFMSMAMIKTKKNKLGICRLPLEIHLKNKLEVTLKYPLLGFPEYFLLLILFQIPKILLRILLEVCDPRATCIPDDLVGQRTLWGHITAVKAKTLKVFWPRYLPCGIWPSQFLQVVNLLRFGPLISRGRSSNKGSPTEKDAGSIRALPK